MHYALSAWIAEALKYKSLTHKHSVVHRGHCMKCRSHMHKPTLFGESAPSVFKVERASAPPTTTTSWLSVLPLTPLPWLSCDTWLIYVLPDSGGLFICAVFLKKDLCRKWFIAACSPSVDISPVRVVCRGIGNNHVNWPECVSASVYTHTLCINRISPSHFLDFSKAVSLKLWKNNKKMYCQIALGIPTAEVTDGVPQGLVLGQGTSCTNPISEWN